MFVHAVVNLAVIDMCLNVTGNQGPILICFVFFVPFQPELNSPGRGGLKAPVLVSLHWHRSGKGQ